MVVRVGGQAEGGFSLQVTEMYTIHRIGQDGHWQQFDTLPF